MRTLSLAPAIVITIALGSHARTQNPPIRVVTLDSTRFSDCSPGFRLNFFGPFFTSARGALLSPTNFGPQGVVSRAISLVEVPSLTPAVLSNADVVLLAHGKSWPTLDEEESMLVDSFVLAGGGLLWTYNFVAQELQDMLLATPGPVDTSTQKAVVSDGTSPLVNGPFGAVPSGTSLPRAYAGSFLGLPPGARAAVTLGGRPFAIDVSLGRGRIAAFCDEEIFVNSSLANCAVANLTSQWNIILLDTMAWVTPAAGFSFTSADIVLTSYGSSCANGVTIPPQLTLLGNQAPGGNLRFTVRLGPAGALAALALGTQRAALPLFSCTLLVPPVLVLPITLDGAMSARPGTFALTVSNLPAAPGSLLDTQALVLDALAAGGFTMTRGAEATL